MANTTTTCTRCNGTGNHSYHALHGSVCFGCNGAGTVTVNLADVARRDAARAARDIKSDANRAISANLYDVISAEFAITYNVDLSSPAGIHILDHAVRRATGRTIAQHRDARMS